MLYFTLKIADVDLNFAKLPKIKVCSRLIGRPESDMLFTTTIENYHEVRLQLNMPELLILHLF